MVCSYKSKQNFFKERFPHTYQQLSAVDVILPVFHCSVVALISWVSNSGYSSAFNFGAHIKLCLLLLFNFF